MLQSVTDTLTSIGNPHTWWPSYYSYWSLNELEKKNSFVPRPAKNVRSDKGIRAAQPDLLCFPNYLMMLMEYFTFFLQGVMARYSSMAFILQRLYWYISKPKPHQKLHKEQSACFCGDFLSHTKVETTVTKSCGLIATPWSPVFISLLIPTGQSSVMPCRMVREPSSLHTDL